MLQNIPLHHVEQKDGKLYMPDGIINLEEELYRLIQQTALYDYREDHALESLLPREENMYQEFDSVTEIICRQT